LELKLVDHKKYLLEMCEKVDRDLTSSTCKKLREHLEKCPDCAAYYDSLKKTITLYRNYNVEYSGSCCEEVLAHLEAEQPMQIKLPMKSRRKIPRH